MRYDHLDRENGTFIQPDEYEYVYMSIFDISLSFYLYHFGMIKLRLLV